MGSYLTQMKCACRHCSFVRESLAHSIQTRLTTSGTEVLSMQILETSNAVSIYGSMLWTCSRETWTPSAPWLLQAYCRSRSFSPSCCRTEPRVSWGHRCHLRTWWGSSPKVCWKLSVQLNKVGQCLQILFSSARPCQSFCTSFVSWRRCRVLQRRTTSRRKPSIGGFHVNHLQLQIVMHKIGPSSLQMKQVKMSLFALPCICSVTRFSIECKFSLSLWVFFTICWCLSTWFRFLKLHPCGKNGYSPLHLAVDRNTTCVGRYPVCKFPSLTVASILLECGADVNSRDEDDNRSVLNLPSVEVLAHTLIFYFPGYN